MTTTITKSAGHLGWIESAASRDLALEVYEQEGQVYIANAANPLDVWGFRQGGRWECSRSHWDRNVDHDFGACFHTAPHRCPYCGAVGLKADCPDCSLDHKARVILAKGPSRG